MREDRETGEIFFEENGKEKISRENYAKIKCSRQTTYYLSETANF